MAADLPGALLFMNVLPRPVVILFSRSVTVTVPLRIFPFSSVSMMLARIRLLSASLKALMW